MSTIDTIFIFMLGVAATQVVKEVYSLYQDHVKKNSPTTLYFSVVFKSKLTREESKFLGDSINEYITKLCEDFCKRRWPDE
jgi:hypothetical protein